MPEDCELPVEPYSGRPTPYSGKDTPADELLPEPDGIELPDELAVEPVLPGDPGEGRDGLLELEPEEPLEGKLGEEEDDDEDEGMPDELLGIDGLELLLDELGELGELDELDGELGLLLDELELVVSHPARTSAAQASASTFTESMPVPLSAECWLMKSYLFAVFYCIALSFTSGWLRKRCFGL